MGPLLCTVAPLWMSGFWLAMFGLMDGQGFRPCLVNRGSLHHHAFALRVTRKMHVSTVVEPSCAVQRPALVPNAALAKALHDVRKSACQKVVRTMYGTQPRATPLADDCGLPSSARSAANLTFSGKIQVCHFCGIRTCSIEIRSGCSMAYWGIRQVS